MKDGQQNIVAKEGERRWGREGGDEGKSNGNRGERNRIEKSGREI